MKTVRLVALLLVASAAAATIWAAVRSVHRSTDVYYNTGLLAGSLRHDEPVPLYSPDAADPWNRLHHLIFSKTIRGRAVGTLAAGAGQTLITRIEGGDRLISPWAGGVDYVLDDSRFRVLDATIRDVEREAGRRSVPARFAFQQELWEAYDDLESYTEIDGRYAARARAIMPRLARLITRLALTDDELWTLETRSSRDLPDPEQWSEVAVRSGHSHDFLFDHRVAFRTLVRLPATYQQSRWLEKRMARINTLERLGNTAGQEVAFMAAVSDLSTIPPGTTMVLTSQFLAINDAGQVRPTKITRDLQLISVLETGMLNFSVREFRLALWLNGTGSALAATDPRRPVYSDTQPFPLEGEAVTSLKSQHEHCLHCHAGHMFTTLNRTSGFLPVQIRRFADATTIDQVAAAKQATASYQQFVRDSLAGRQ